ncbi:hypothetical protein HDU98_002839 [Podochytrium sp. JEL0797]|nr:hypothetical protein HDU98_002839 [Podochytrium sp. JEL0797]
MLVLTPALLAMHRYLQVSNIAAAALRRALKPDAKLIALKREEQFIKYSKWSNGKQGEIVSTRCGLV